uniref:Uncharacterized protein n=1 Tax=Avena sativa TaxID=4498 RepID=A0ACD5X9M5_AVESA
MALRRRLFLCGLCICLFLAVALGAGVPVPPPQAATDLSSGNCYLTEKSVPSWCAQQFIKALFVGVDKSPIRDYCCEMLTCIHEPTCASVLQDICPPPPKWSGWPCPPHHAGRVRLSHLP